MNPTSSISYIKSLIIIIGLGMRKNDEDGLQCNLAGLIVAIHVGLPTCHGHRLSE